MDKWKNFCLAKITISIIVVIRKQNIIINIIIMMTQL
jgi:hypothetical protein